MKNDIEGQLVRHCQGGDRQAYATLVDTYGRVVFAICLNATGNSHDAEDLSQEVFIKGFIKIGRIKDCERFGPWIIKICKNQCTDYLRCRTRHEQRTRDLVMAHKDKTTVSAPNNEFEYLENVLKQIPDLYRQPLLWYYLDGYDTGTIAKMMDMTHAGVLTRLCRARQLLRERLR